MWFSLNFWILQNWIVENNITYVQLNCSDLIATTMWISFMCHIHIQFSFYSVNDSIFQNTLMNPNISIQWFNCCSCSVWVIFLNTCIANNLRVSREYTQMTCVPNFILKSHSSPQCEYSQYIRLKTFVNAGYLQCEYS